MRTLGPLKNPYDTENRQVYKQHIQVTIKYA